MGAKSNNLFHFTKSVEFLKGILLNGFLPRYCLEDTGYLGIDYTGMPMTCFCDIPISRIAEHTAFYGEYGVGMTKEWGLRNGLAPIIYTTPTGAIADLANYLLTVSGFDIEDISEKTREKLNHHLSRLISLTKPINGKMVIGGSILDKDFYQENEWRYVPEDFSVVFKENFDVKREELNKEAEAHKLSFSPSDVKYIYVKSDAEIPTIFDFIQNNLGRFPHNEIKILTSRILSLETIARDL